MATATKDKILTVAKRLFAERGFAQTSLREVTLQAGVNLAAVNYHFGGKKELIKAVLRNYLDIVMPRLHHKLSMLDEDAVQLSMVLAQIKETLIELDQEEAGSAVIFINLIARGYMENQGYLRWLVTQGYAKAFEQLIERLMQATPTIDKETLFWRLHFSLGSMIFTLSSSQALSDIAMNDFNKRMNLNDICEEMLPFIEKGISQTTEHKRD